MNPSITEKLFHLELRNTRTSKGYNQTDAAKLLDISISTLRRWESGEVIPGRIARETALMVLRHSQCAPSEAKQRALQDSHHLWFEKDRGWVLRCTVEISKKQIGKRIKVRLRTRDLEEAIGRRDLIVGQYQKLGLKIADRRQKNHKASVIETTK